MKKLVLLVVFFLFLGCNSNDKDTNKTIDNNRTNFLTQKEPLYQEQWALHYDRAFYKAYDIDKDAHIHAKESIKKYSGRGVKVGIIDLDIDDNHTEYSLTKVINSRDGTSTIKCNDMEICYHGTAVAGVIASNINGVGLRGIAPDVDLTFINLDLKGFVSDSEILDVSVSSKKKWSYYSI